MQIAIDCPLPVITAQDLCVTGESNLCIIRDDEWSDWLLHRRHLHDPECEQLVSAAVKRIRDRVLDGASLREDMTLVDIGTGDGNIAFGAIERAGPSLQVILTDISTALLRHAEAKSVERGVREQCRFIRCSAESLFPIPDASVDVVAMRAVLAYVGDKSAALNEIHRVLKPGGLLSFAEPVFRDDAIETIELKKRIDLQLPESINLFLLLLQRWKAAQFPDTTELMSHCPITNYSERDVFRYVCNSGFVEVQLNLHMEVVPCPIRSWQVFLELSPYPWAPSLDTILKTQFTQDEREYFEQTVRPIVESGQATSTNRNVYVTARKPLT